MDIIPCAQAAVGADVLRPNFTFANSLNLSLHKAAKRLHFGLEPKFIVAFVDRAPLGGINYTSDMSFELIILTFKLQHVNA